MTSAVWRLDNRIAQLDLPQLNARLDLSRPGDGLADVRFASNEFCGARLMKIAIPPHTPGDADSVVEAFVRSADLTTAYQESDSQPVRVDARWRALDRLESSQAATIELLLSVTTQHLESCAELTVQSTLPEVDVLRLTDGPPVPVELPTVGHTAEFSPADGPACFLFRPPGAEFSYVEMVHPSDFHRIELACVDEPARSVRFIYRLFAEPLEKGVIVRARLEGCFCSRRHDAQTAAEVYSSFCSGALPLGT